MEVEKREVLIKKATLGFARNYQIEQTLHKIHSFSDERLVGLEVDKILHFPYSPSLFTNPSFMKETVSFLSHN